MTLDLLTSFSRRIKRRVGSRFDDTSLLVSSASSRSPALIGRFKFPKSPVGSHERDLIPPTDSPRSVREAETSTFISLLRNPNIYIYIYIQKYRAQISSAQERSIIRFLGGAETRSPPVPPLVRAITIRGGIVLSGGQCDGLARWRDRLGAKLERGLTTRLLRYDSLAGTIGRLSRRQFSFIKRARRADNNSLARTRVDLFDIIIIRRYYRRPARVGRRVRKAVKRD